MQLANQSLSCLGAHYTHSYHSGIWLLYRCGGALLQCTFSVTYIVVKINSLVGSSPMFVWSGVLSNPEMNVMSEYLMIKKKNSVILCRLYSILFYT